MTPGSVSSVLSNHGSQEREKGPLEEGAIERGKQGTVLQRRMEKLQEVLTGEEGGKEEKRMEEREGGTEGGKEEERKVGRSTQRRRS